MSTATITSKGQITIPAAVRAALHVGPGDRVEFVQIGEGRYEMVAATKEVSRLRGLVKTGKVISVDEMDKVVRARAGK